MLVVIAYHAGDQALTVNLLRWIAELGCGKNHEVMLLHAMTTDASETLPLAREAFGAVTVMEAYEDIPGWPQGPNLLWSMAVRQIANTHPKALPAMQPWLFLEPDAVPLTHDTFDRIAAEYERAGKPFMGAKVQIDGISTHLSGNAVYPGLTINYTRRLAELGPIAFDVFLAPDFLPHAHFTQLIQHHAWTSRNADNEPTFDSPESLSIIRPDAVIFHRCKSDKLINLLRARRSQSRGSSVVERTNHLGEVGSSNLPPATIYTYFMPVEGINRDDAVKLLDLWSSEWRKAGWNPVVEDESMARSHPLFAAYEKAIMVLPTINPKAYERACFMRWLAMVAVGGGWMCDYDVMPGIRSFQLLPITDRLTIHQNNNPCPSVVSGSSAEFERMCRIFMGWKPSAYDLAHEHGPHVSDQNIIQQIQGEYDLTECVTHYGSKAWRDSYAVHFPSQVMEKYQPRWEWIPKLLEDSISPTMIAREKAISEEVKPKTLSEQIREHCDALKLLIDGMPGRRAMFHAELRKAGLLAKASFKKK